MRDDTPSRTALKVALAVLILGGDDYGRSQCPPGAVSAQVQLLREARLPFGRFPWIIRNATLAKLARFFASLLIHKNLLEGVGRRKCFMEHHVRTCIAQGCRQVLIIAAGYDTLAFRLSNEFRKVQFWELDHPATGNVKQRALRGMGAPTNLYTITADLTKTTLKQVLTKQQEYDTSKQTVVVMEGLLYYLSESEVKDLFASVAQEVGSESSVCFDYFGWKNGMVDHGWLSPILSWYVQLLGEPWKWGIDPKDLSGFFRDSWRVAGETECIGLERLACVELKQKAT